jgi:cyclopropane-fatty-acyl-phospholipid synthase
MWEFYLAGGIVGFESGTMCNYQLQYARDRHALPITRDYMLAAEAQLCGQEKGPDAKRRAPRSRSKATA